MSRLSERFAELRSQHRTALIPYVTAGDPRPDITVPLLHRLVEAGADVLEIGVPFSDPMADGPVIQAACERALAHGTHLSAVLDMVSEFRERDADTPIVLMGYLNPIEALGLDKFIQSARAAGVDAVLPVDLSAPEAPDIAPQLQAAGLDLVCLVAPTTSEQRMQSICANASGFLYYVSLKGVTGAQGLDADAIGRRVASLREYSDLPIGVGFGIRTPQDAAAVGQVADGVVVGSALVARMAELAADPDQLLSAVPAILADMRQALDAALAPAMRAEVSP